MLFKKLYIIFFFFFFWKNLKNMGNMGVFYKNMGGNMGIMGNMGVVGTLLLSYLTSDVNIDSAKLSIIRLGKGRWW